MRRALLLAGLLCLACAAPAAAGTAGTWTPVAPVFDQNFGVAGMTRTADGVLHVVAQANNPTPNLYDIVHTPVAPSGAVGPQSTVAAGWAATQSPDIAPAPGGGLAVMWGGLHSSTTGDPQNDSGIATSDDSGSAWNLSPVAPVTGGGGYASQWSIVNSGGTLFQSWFATGGTYVHRGTDQSTPDNDFQAQIGGYGSLPGFAVDGASGSLWLGWQAGFAKEKNGAYAQQVDQATGAPVGSPAKMPGSSVDYQGSTESITVLGRTPITGRPGRAGVWMAYTSGYPSADKVLVWKVGDGASTTLEFTKGVGHRTLAITSDPDGRVIVVWSRDGAGEQSQLFARVSNTDVTAWGPAFAIPGLPKASGGWSVQASAQSGALIDVVRNWSQNTDTTMRFWHTQALPPPVLGKAVNARVLSGVVLIKVPGSSAFIPLSHESQIPVGAILDATNGRVRVVTAVPGAKTQSADFFQGAFVVTQAKSGLADLTLFGGNFAACGKAARAAAGAKNATVRNLWGTGAGKFRTKGRYATAAIRGTTWLTSDRCDGTLVKVTKGSVTVRDLVAKKSVVLTKGQSYLAKKR
jgi:hypothetical protein